MQNAQFVVVGGSGRLGKLICEVLEERKLKSLIPTRQERVDQAYWGKLLDKAHPTVIIDVSLAEGTHPLINTLNNISTDDAKSIHLFLTGVTGLSDSSMQALKDFSKKVPVCHTTNFSKGVMWFRELLTAKTSHGTTVAQMAKDLGFDLGLVETHHTKKLDAPSGTAKTLASEAQIGLDKVTALRVGDVIGEHTLIASGKNEEIKVTHTAFSRKMFAEGAVDAAMKAAATRMNLGMTDFKNLL